MLAGDWSLVIVVSSLIIALYSSFISIFHLSIVSLIVPPRHQLVQCMALWSTVAVLVNIVGSSAYANGQNWIYGSRYQILVLHQKLKFAKTRYVDTAPVYTICNYNFLTFLPFLSFLPFSTQLSHSVAQCSVPFDTTHNRAMEPINVVFFFVSHASNSKCLALLFAHLSSYHGIFFLLKLGPLFGNKFPALVNLVLR